jgi:hypothetical protein
MPARPQQIPLELPMASRPVAQHPPLSHYKKAGRGGGHAQTPRTRQRSESLRALERRLADAQRRFDTLTSASSGDADETVEAAEREVRDLTRTYTRAMAHHGRAAQKKRLARQKAGIGGYESPTRAVGADSFYDLANAAGATSPVSAIDLVDSPAAHILHTPRRDASAGSPGSAAYRGSPSSSSGRRPGAGAPASPFQALPPRDMTLPDLARSILEVDGPIQAAQLALKAQNRRVRDAERKLAAGKQYYSQVPPKYATAIAYFEQGLQVVSSPEQGGTECEAFDAVREQLSDALEQASADLRKQQVIAGPPSPAPTNFKRLQILC